MEVGGLVQVSLGICIFFKSYQHYPKPVGLLIYHVYYVYIDIVIIC